MIATAPRRRTGARARVASVTGRDLPPITAALFDNDGVLVDSHASVEEAWTLLAEEYDLDAAEVLARVHGRPSRVTVAELVPESLQARALARVDALELETADSVRALPGAAECLAALDPDRWAVVTSGTRALARARLAAAGIPQPRVVVTADDVRHGKPDPEPYVTAAARLGQPPRACVVLEDAAPGVASARAAGAGYVVGVGHHTTAYDVDHVVAHLGEVRVEAAFLVLPQARRPGHGAEAAR